MNFKKDPFYKEVQKDIAYGIDGIIENVFYIKKISSDKVSPRKINLLDELYELNPHQGIILVTLKYQLEFTKDLEQLCILENHITNLNKLQSSGTNILTLFELYPHEIKHIKVFSYLF